MTQKITLGWADDNQSFKTAVLMLLRHDASHLIDVLFTVSNGKELLDQLDTQFPDIILLDIRMPIMDGIQTARIIKEKYAHAKIIAFTEHDFEANIVEMNKVGVKSFVTKSKAEDLIKSIKIVHGGGVFFPDEVAEILQKFIRNIKETTVQQFAEQPQLKIVLTPQEKKRVQLLRQGNTSKEIAVRLNLTVRTIRTYRERLLKKTKTRNVAELLNVCYRSEMTNV